jgi:hypothetical protein
MSWLFGDISSGTTPDSRNGDYYDGDVNWVTTSELRERAIRETSQQITHSALAAHSALKVYPPGTLLIAMYDDGRPRGLGPWSLLTAWTGWSDWWCDRRFEETSR